MLIYRTRKSSMGFSFEDNFLLIITLSIGNLRLPYSI